MTPYSENRCRASRPNPVQQKLSIRYRHGTGLVSSGVVADSCVIATLLSIWFRISTALSEIVVGTVAQLIIGALIGTEVLGAKSAWSVFWLEREPSCLRSGWGRTGSGIFRTKWKEAMVVGMVGFFAPFLGAAAVAHFVLRWSVASSWLAGVAHPLPPLRSCMRSCSNWA